MKITINKTVRYTHLKKEFVVHTLKKKKKKKNLIECPFGNSLFRWNRKHFVESVEKKF